MNRRQRWRAQPRRLWNQRPWHRLQHVRLCCLKTPPPTCPLQRLPLAHLPPRSLFHPLPARGVPSRPLSLTYSHHIPTISLVSRSTLSLPPTTHLQHTSINPCTRPTRHLSDAGLFQLRPHNARRPVSRRVHAHATVPGHRRRHRICTHTLHPMPSHSPFPCRTTPHTLSLYHLPLTTQRSPSTQCTNLPVQHALPRYAPRH